MQDSMSEQENKTNIQLILQSLKYVEKEVKTSNEKIDRLELKVDHNFASKERVANLESRVVILEIDRKEMVKAVTELDRKMTRVITVGIIGQVVFLPLVLGLVVSWFK